MRCFAILLLAALCARAQDLGAEQPVAASLVASRNGVKPGGSLALAVRFRIQPGWHLYWRNPGDSGLAPSIAWKLPGGVKAGEIRWPAPERIEGGGIVTFGYEEELLLLCTLQVPADFHSEKLHIEAAVSWLTCSDICIDGHATLRLDLPADPAAKEIHAALFRRARESLPRPLPPGTATLHAAGKALRLEIDAKKAGFDATARLAFFPTGQGVLRYDRKQTTTREKDRITLLLPLAKDRDAPLKTLEGVLVAEKGGGRTAFAIRLPVRG